MSELTPEEKEERAKRMLARRLVDIDPAEDHEKGCPAYLAAFPMITDFADSPGFLGTNRRADPFILSLLQADGQGRVCEIGEIQHKAKRFLERP